MNDQAFERAGNLTATILAAGCLAAAGCVGPQITDGEGASGMAAARGTWNQDGEMEMTTPGAVVPTQYSVGEVEGQTGGPNHILGLNTGELAIASANPTVTAMRNLEILLTDGRATSIKIGELTTDPAASIAAYDAQVIQAFRTAEGITAQQRAVFEATLEATSDVAKAIAAALAPVPVP